MALEDAGVFTSGGLVKDKVNKYLLLTLYDFNLLSNLILMLWMCWPCIYTHTHTPSLLSVMIITGLLQRSGTLYFTWPWLNWESR